MKLGNHMLKAAMLSTISIASLSVGSAAFAQDNTPQASDAADDNVIIVTATKREQTLQEIPVAVTVTSAETIERAQVRDLIDLQTVAPTLRVSQNQTSGNATFSIRGFGNGGNNTGVEPSVGIFIDGVYRSRAGSGISDLPNLKRVEILRGPQSTLFGKNASAGVISIVTQEPKYEFGGSAEASYGNYNAIVLKADVTGPLAENVAFSLAGGINKRDGYATIINTGEKSNERDRWFTRGQLLLEPSDTVKFRIIGDFDRIDENCCVAGNVLDGPTGGIVRLLGGAVNSNKPFDYRVNANFATTNEMDNYGGSVQGDFELGSLSLTSITAYRGSDSSYVNDADFTSAALLDSVTEDRKIRTFTQELRLASDFDGPLNFLLGGYYFNEDIEQQASVAWGAQSRGYVDTSVKIATANALSIPLLEATFGALEGAPGRYTNKFLASGQGLDENYTLKDEAWSIFGTVDFEISDRVTLTGGFNYTKDKKKFTTDVISTDIWSGVNFDAPQYALFRQQLLYGGALANGLPAPMALTYATVNANNAALNPLNTLKPLQFLPPYLNLPNSVEDGKSADDDLSYTARIAWKATDSINVYASYATGFKASSVNLSRDSRPLLSDRAALTAAGLTLSNQSYGTRLANPEKAKVFEVGIKGNWDQASFNLTAFNQAINDFQENLFIGTGFVLSNAGKRTTKGIEFDGMVRPTEALSFSVSMVYLDAKYDSFVQSAFGDISGQRVSGVPELATTLGAVFEQPFGDGNTFVLSGSYHYESSTPQQDGGLLATYSREVNSIDASASVELSNGVQFSLWGRNLGNHKYLTTIFPSVAQAGSISGYPSLPRTYGASVKYKF
ncbi:TonB-dependent receptor [Sphingorhabdus sp.]|jgi:outer membrane receptor protein involved in Fe transport|uniref:TonB-dependent receptor n=1 Tax=Sphingorhabdus sp. TaxID=1902408 RepID=UPI003784DA7D